MTAGRYDFEVEQGGTFNPTLTWKDSTGALVNLTGATARMQVRDNHGAATTVLELTTENGRITLGGAAGTIALLVSAADMAAIVVPDAPGPRPTRDCVYDLELVIAGVVTRLLRGAFIIFREVTR